MAFEERNQINGLWKGKMVSKIDSVNISILIDNNKSYFNCDEILINCLVIEYLELKDGIIHFNIQPGDTKLVFKGIVNENNILGKVSSDNSSSDLEIEFEVNKNVNENYLQECSFEEIFISNKNDKLFSQIIKPEKILKCPAILMLHGSHTNLANQYISEAKIYKKLGFIVLTFDKRGNGKSTGNYKSITFNDLIDDAIACLKYLRSRNDVDKERIGIWGFSQGASILPMISSRSEIPSFMIAKSPEIISLTESAIYQDSIRIKEKGFSEKDCDVVIQSHKNVEKLIFNGAKHNEVETYIKNNAKIYGFMNETALFENIKIPENEFDSWAWKGRITKFDPFWKNMNIPALVFWGSNDTLVNPLENIKKIRSFNLKNIEVKIFKNADHNITYTSNNRIEGMFPKLTKEYQRFIKRWLINKNIIS